MRKTTISIVVPVFNEEDRLFKTFNALMRLRLPNFFKLKEIIFVNDGSTDDSKNRIEKFKSQLEVKTKSKVIILSYRTNKGKGYAVRVGMKVSTATYTLLMDADMATPLSEIKKFIPYIKSNIDVILGTRKNGHSTVVVPQPLYRQALGHVFTKLTHLILNVPVTDFTCGFKLFSQKSKQEIFKRAMVNRWSYDAEVIFLASKLGFTLAEQAVTWRDDRRSKVSIINDSITSFVDLLKIKANEMLGNYGFLPSYNLVSPIATNISAELE